MAFPMLEVVILVTCWVVIFNADRSIGLVPSMNPGGFISPIEQQVSNPPPGLFRFGGEEHIQKGH